MEFNIEEYVPESNLKAFLMVLGWICKYKFTSVDWDAFEPAIPKTDSEAGEWFDYTFNGKSVVDIRLGLEVGCGMVQTKLKIPPELEAQAHLALEIFGCFAVAEPQLP